MKQDLRLLPSEEWMKVLKVKCKIQDHATGWDKKNFARSWFKEKIDREEFFRRLNRSKVFHIYKASIDHCSCAQAQFYRDKSKIHADHLKYGPVYSMNGRPVPGGGKV